jgi:ankyrin repeat protein
MAAATQGHVPVVQALLAKGADATRRDYTGRTALMWAEWSRKAAVVAALRQAGVRE